MHYERPQLTTVFGAAVAALAVCVWSFSPNPDDGDSEQFGKVQEETAEMQTHTVPSRYGRVIGSEVQNFNSKSTSLEEPLMQNPNRNSYIIGTLGGVLGPYYRY